MSFFANDPEALARFRAGERGTLALVYQHYVRDVARSLRAGFPALSADGPSFIPGLESIFDVECGCHEVFMRAFGDSARHAFDGRRPYATYLRRIARNWRIDLHRRRAPWVTADGLAEVPSAEAGPARQFADAELAELIERFVEGLSERDGGYYIARFREGLTQQDAAASRGMTRIQGRRIEHRLKRDLLEYLDRHGYGVEK